MHIVDTVSNLSREVSATQPPFIIAEVSGNHNNDLDRALAIIDAAAEAGAEAVKFQTYTAETMTIDLNEGPFHIADPKSLWHGESLYQLYQKAHTPWSWHKTLFDHCRKRGVIPFSSPFDATAVDFLETLSPPLYKIASFENIDLPLIRRVAATKKPLIISSGLASAGEILEAVTTAREAGCQDIIVLKCTSSYPASPENSHLKTIPHMQNLLNCPIGISDHTLGLGAALAGVALGAVAIEKHVTLSRDDGGVDSAFSLEPEELRALVKESKNAWQATGKIHYGPTPAEIPSLNYRRTLYIVKDVKKGERFTKENLRAIRPGGGLPPKYLETLLGKKAGKEIRKGTAVHWNLLEED
ncbi:pseudaminic acid synthase [Magnetococcales bacterium HHB-1]